MTLECIAAFGDGLKQAKTPNEYWNICMRAYDNLGVSGIGYGVFPIPSLATTGKLTDAVFFRHSYALEWENAIGKKNLLDADISTELLLAGVEETSWSDDIESLGASPKNIHQFEVEHDLGMIWGKTLLLSHNSSSPVTSGIGLHISCVNSNEEFQRYWAEHRTDLRAISDALDAGMLGRHKDGLVQLTGREKDYLYWSAMGLDRIETARRLGISENTIDKPIASAKKKLKARNTSQAVVKAVLLGLINL